MLRVGLISDTHGLLRAEAVSFLRGSDFIVHAGDVCDPRILEQLHAIAPLTAVRGNNDRGPWAENLPDFEFVRVGGIRILVVHDLASLAIDPAATGVGVVVSGHSHKPLAEERDGVLFVNPGSAGPRRFRLPIAVAELLVEKSAVSARVTELAAPHAAQPLAQLERRAAHDVDARSPRRAG